MALRGAMLIPSAVTKTLICIDDFQNSEPVGKIYNPYLPDAVPFHGIIQFIEILEKFFDEISFPQAHFATREFTKQKPLDQELDSEEEDIEIVQYHSESILEAHKGELVTFTLQVMLRQNATWQGILIWSEKQQSQKFRSTLELLRLIQEAMEQCMGPAMVSGWH